MNIFYVLLILLFIIILFLLFAAGVCIILFPIWIIKPNKKRDTSYFQKKLYAHRGLHDEVIPENSLLAFKAAREKGYGVELDVQMTKDEKLVVFHDGNISRMCGKDAFIRDLTYDELKEYRLKDSDQTIPLFEDVLSVLGTTDLICEIKGDNGDKNYFLCEKVYDMLSTYKGRFCIESFSPYLVRWFKKNHPEIIRGQLSQFFSSKDGLPFLARVSMTHLMVNVISRPDFIAYRYQDADKLGFKLVTALFHPFTVAWTAKGEEEQLRAWKKFDAVIFEKNK